MSKPQPVRPPRTAAHAERDRLTRLFHDAGLVPVLSTNGGEPNSDIELVLGTKPGELREAWVKPAGVARYRAASPIKADALIDIELGLSR
jgi:hypothetical protein